MRIYLVRHGETDWNAGRKWQGITDIPLNARGREQARLAAERLKNAQAARVYCSPLGRARDTAAAIAGVIHAEVLAVPALMELNAGVFEGAPYDELAVSPVFIEWARGETRVEGGESIRDVSNRVVPAVMGIAEREAGDFVVVAHSIVIRTFVNHALGLPFYERKRYVIDNCAVTTAEYSRERGLRILTLNERVD